jgi:hypothetical protein
MLQPPHCCRADAAPAGQWVDVVAVELLLQFITHPLKAPGSSTHSTVSNMAQQTKVVRKPARSTAQHSTAAAWHSICLSTTQPVPVEQFVAHNAAHGL